MEEEELMRELREEKEKRQMKKLMMVTAIFGIFLLPANGLSSGPRRA